jgi:hypothetical protein
MNNSILLYFFSDEKYYNSQRLDFLILITILIENMVRLFTPLSFTFVAFRLLRAFKIAGEFKNAATIRNIMETLEMASMQMASVIVVILLFLCAICALLLTFLQGNFSRRCVVFDQHVDVCVSDFSTGWASACDLRNWTQHKTVAAPEFKVDISDAELATALPLMVDDYYPFERWCKFLVPDTPGQYDGLGYDVDFKGRYHSCGLQLNGLPRPHYRKGSEMCVEVGNPNFGFSHFDDVGG